MEKGNGLPLSGIRVLEVAFYIVGPFAGQMLADLGAEVIKVEDPAVGGDLLRAGGQGGSFLDLPDHRPLLFEASNRNKKSMTLDLRKPEAQEVLYRLVEKSDVFITTVTPKAQRRFGCEEETLSRYNPDLIYASASTFGSRGPDAGYPGQDTTGTARSGMMMSTLRGDEPYYPPHYMGDFMSGTLLAFGIMTSLLTRERLGVARAVEASQLRSMMWLQLLGIELYANKGIEWPKWERKRANSPLLNMYKCRDGKWIALGMARSVRDWPVLAEIMGIGQYADDPRFNTGLGRQQHSSELVEILDQAFATRTRDEWEEVFRKREIWYSIVNTLPDLLTDPQVLANDHIAKFGNGLTMPTLPFRLDIPEVPLKGGTPALGADTTEILANVGGYSWEEVAAMVAAGVV